MDLNFHLLTSQQIEKLQNICLFKSILSSYEQFSFSAVREKTNIIIENSTPTGSHPVFDDRIAKKINGIREAIHNEKERRRTVLERTLPDGMTPDDIYEDWPEDGDFWDRNVNPGDLGDFDDNMENWPEDLERHIDDNYDNPEEYDSLIDIYSEALLNVELPDQRGDHSNNNIIHTIGAESYFIATNTDLRIMALELFRLKSEQLHATYVANSASGVSTLGLHLRYNDVKRKNDVFLFPDNIQNETNAITASGFACSFDDVLEVTFIHEMFHAFYSYNSCYDLIFLRNFHEIEEAMAEMGTMWFCSIYQKGRLFNLAEKIVKGKWSGTNHALFCYGLGYHLYYYWAHRQYYMISGYQLVQRLFRYGNPNVVRFCRELSVQNDRTCCDILNYMINWLRDIKGNPSKHLFFRNQTTGEKNTLVFWVLNHIASRGGRVPKLIWVNGTRGGHYQEVFKEDSRITRSEQKDFDTERRIKIGSAHDYRLWKYWNSGLDGNTISFIDEIIRCYNHGWISDRVTII